MYITQCIIMSLFHRTVVKFNSMRPSDVIWRHRAWSTLARVMACCLTAPSHYLNQCWLIHSKGQSHSSGNHFTKGTSAIYHWNQFENHLTKFSFKSPRGQWVNVSAHNLDRCLTSPARGCFTDLTTYVNVTAYDNFTEAKTPKILRDHGLNSYINVEALLWNCLYQNMVNMTAANAFGPIHFVHFM